MLFDKKFHQISVDYLFTLVNWDQLIIPMNK